MSRGITIIVPLLMIITKTHCSKSCFHKYFFRVQNNSHPYTTSCPTWFLCWTKFEPKCKPMNSFQVDRPYILYVKVSKHMLLWHSKFQLSLFCDCWSNIWWLIGVQIVALSSTFFNPGLDEQKIQLLYPAF